MLSREDNDLVTQTGPGTPGGGLMRAYWQPAALVSELPQERPVAPVRLLGEDLVLFRDKQNRIGLITEACPHRRASLALGIPTLRLRADYFAITTIAAAEILRLVVRSGPADDLTGSVFGLQGIATRFFELNPIPAGRHGIGVPSSSRTRSSPAPART